MEMGERQTGGKRDRLKNNNNVCCVLDVETVMELQWRPQQT